MKNAVVEAGAPQPDSFAFTSENLARAEKIIARYPRGRQASAVMPLLDLAQRQHENWLPRAAMDYVADMLEMPRIRVYEVATFYTMYNLRPRGRKLVEVCTTTPCWLRGSAGVLGACSKALGIRPGEVTADGEWGLTEVECQGACVNAPMVKIGDDFYEDLTPELAQDLLSRLKAGGTVKAGSQIGRQTSCPVGGPTTLKADKGKAVP